jgi:hypothetical protein
MPVWMPIYGGETDPIIFPLTADGGTPLDLTGVTAVQLVKSGWNGRLAAVTIGAPTVEIIDPIGGLVQWSPSAADLDPRQGPYRVYFRFTLSDGRMFTAPRGDYFLLDVRDPLT